MNRDALVHAIHGAARTDRRFDDTCTRGPDAEVDIESVLLAIEAAGLKVVDAGPESDSALARDLAVARDRVEAVAVLTVRACAEFVGLDDFAERTTADLYDELLALDQRPFWSVASFIGEWPPEGKVDWFTLDAGEVVEARPVSE